MCVTKCIMKKWANKVLQGVMNEEGVEHGIWTAPTPFGTI